MRRTLLVLALAVLGAVAPAGLASAAPLSGLVDVTPSQSADDDPYLCIRSHVLLGEDSPICIHLIPADVRQG